jgi:hypothetical protein
MGKRVCRSGGLQVVSYFGLLVVWLVCLRRVRVLSPALSWEPSPRRVICPATSGASAAALTLQGARPQSVYPGLVFGRRGVLGA